MTIIAFIFFSVSLLFVYSLMRAAHDADEQAERIYQKYRREKDCSANNSIKKEAL